MRRRTLCAQRYTFGPGGPLVTKKIGATDLTASLAREHALKRRGAERKDGCGSVPDAVRAGPDDPMGGEIKEIALARSSNKHKLSEGPALCPTTLSALWYIQLSRTGVECIRYVASRRRVRAQDSYLPPLLDQGSPPNQLPAALGRNLSLVLRRGKGF
jgi:hypothetical protein